MGDGGWKTEERFLVWAPFSYFYKRLLKTKKQTIIFIVAILEIIIDIACCFTLKKIILWKQRQANTGILRRYKSGSMT
jgi:hypothetical protein